MYKRQPVRGERREKQRREAIHPPDLDAERLLPDVYALLADVLSVPDVDSDYTRALRRGEAATLYPHIGGNLTKALLEMRRSRIFLERIADAEDYYARGWLSLAARRYETIPDEFLTPQQKERRDSVLRWERARRKRNLFYFAFVIWCVVLFIILVALLS